MLETLEKWRHYVNSCSCKENGQIAIAADTLTKLGNIYESAEYISSNSKIVQDGQNYFAHVGHASFGLVLNSLFVSRKKSFKLDSAQAVFEMAREIHPILKNDYFLNPNRDSDDEFETSQHQYLIANAYGIFGVYSYRSVQEYSKFYSFGSGSEFALGAMEALYDLDFSAEEIARKAVEAAAKFNDGTGLPVEVHALKAKR